jgi:hypothetical protein
MVAETSRPVADVARELAMSETSLGIWVPFHQCNCPEDAGAAHGAFRCPDCPGRSSRTRAAVNPVTRPGTGAT